MRCPSGEKAGSVSSQVLDVIWWAFEPSMSATHSSSVPAPPGCCLTHTTFVPSGLTSGQRSLATASSVIWWRSLPSVRIE